MQLDNIIHCHTSDGVPKFTSEQEMVESALKRAAVELLTDPLLHPKEKVILDKILAGDLANIGTLDAAYSLSANMTNIPGHGHNVEIPLLIDCTLVIFPWRWIGKSHKVRRGPKTSKHLMQLNMFRAYKKLLHTRIFNRD